MIKKPMNAAVIWAGLAIILLAPDKGHAGETYVIDPDQSAISFRIRHLGLTFVNGVFPHAGGFYTFDDADPANASIWIKVKVVDIDTGNERRDRHLRSPDFFDEKQFPFIIFQSVSIMASDDGQYAVAGDLSLHGVTRRVAVQVSATGFHQDLSGEVRSGFETRFSIKRSDYGMQYMTAIADKADLFVSVEGTRIDSGVSSSEGLDYSFRLKCE